MPDLEMWHVNAFSANPFGGNPAAICFVEDTIDDATMQSIARIMNLSETVFMLPPSHSDADYRARIFSIRRELPFAVHPTMAAAYAFIQRSDVIRCDEPLLLRQECGVGIVEVEASAGPAGMSLFVAQRKPSFVATGLSREAVAAAIGCTTGEVYDSPFIVASTGVPWLLVQLDSLATVRNLSLDFTRIAQLSIAVKAVGLTVFTRQTSAPAAQAHLRSFAPAGGLYEDPVCGSCHGALAAHLNETCRDIAAALRRGEKLVLEQGEEMGLPGMSEVMMRQSDDELKLLVGGRSVATLKGTFRW